MRTNEHPQRTSAMTLTITALVVVVMAVWGFQAFTAPFGDAAADSGSDCTPAEEAESRVLTRGEITVSVYNAGERSGRARSALDLLETAGFKPGAVGNAPDDLEVLRAEVRTTSKDSPAARLVAASFGGDTKIVVVDEDYGPGIDVFIGDDFKQLKSSAPDRITVPAAANPCA